MQKITTLFKRNRSGDYLVYNEVVPGAEWVIEGEGVPTRKWEGTCCLVEDSVFYKRYDAHARTTPPVDFRPAEPVPDPASGHWPGWRPVGPGPEDQWHHEAWANWLNTHAGTMPPDRTYELIGPKVQGNKERTQRHELIPHGQHKLPDMRRSFEEIRAFLQNNWIEGIVWWNPDGRKVKIKRKDYGFER